MKIDLQILASWCILPFWCRVCPRWSAVSTKDRSQPPSLTGSEYWIILSLPYTSIHLVINFDGIDDRLDHVVALSVLFTQLSVACLLWVPCKVDHLHCPGSDPHVSHVATKLQTPEFNEKVVEVYAPKCRQETISLVPLVSVNVSDLIPASFTQPDCSLFSHNRALTTMSGNLLESF